MVDAEKKKADSGVSPSRPRTPSKAQQLSKLYSLPAPLRTFPLPNFVPHNPISLFHVLYTWVSQTINPPSSCPNTPYQGWFSEETRSVHVTDPRSIRALWEQGFYGKGSLSRSEPSWLDREKRRKGVVADQTSEEVTKKRRAERQQAKWERARKEREAIDKRLLEEQVHAPTTEVLSPNERDDAPKLFLRAPVGPLEILSLPNSHSDLASIKGELYSEESQADEKVRYTINGRWQAPVMPNMVPNSQDRNNSNIDKAPYNIQIDQLGQIGSSGNINGHAHLNGLANRSPQTNGSIESSKQIKGQKSVRFSPKVEQTTFLQSEPPSPELAATSITKVEESPVAIQDMEHLQLTMEEAFFLSYSLGVLEICDPKIKSVIPVKDLLSIFRRHSYFPQQGTPPLSPDDPFMISYAVYHHFRSLGWVVRGGTKFSVDYLLYNRGPVFSHAEFAVLIFPSYSDPAWSTDKNKKDYVAKMEKRRWSWLHCINRVNSQVKKTLVLVYVDIPPASEHMEDGLSIDGILKRYKIREFILKRWVSNRSRD